MIPNLILTSVPFKGQSSNSSVRNSYRELLKRNEQIATRANIAVENSVSPTSVDNHISMKGKADQVGQKLDVTV